MRPTFAIAPLVLALSSLLVLGCKAKPSEKACAEAIQNMRHITGQDMSDVGAAPEVLIRSCRGNSSKESVECMRAAKTEEDLVRCEGEAGEKFFREAEEERKKNQEKNAAKSKDEQSAKPLPAPDTKVPAPAPAVPAIDAEELPAGGTSTDAQPEAAGEDSVTGDNKVGAGTP